MTILMDGRQDYEWVSNVNLYKAASGGNFNYSAHFIIIKEAAEKMVQHLSGRLWSAIPISRPSSAISNCHYPNQML